MTATFQLLAWLATDALSTGCSAWERERSAMESGIASACCDSRLQLKAEIGC